MSHFVSWVSIYINLAKTEKSFASSTFWSFQILYMIFRDINYG